MNPSYFKQVFFVDPEIQIIVYGLLGIKISEAGKRQIIAFMNGKQNLLLVMCDLGEYLSENNDSYNKMFGLENKPSRGTEKDTLNIEVEINGKKKVVAFDILFYESTNDFGSLENFLFAVARWEYLKRRDLCFV